MTKLGTITLISEDSNPLLSGAAFLLTSRSTQSHVIEINGGEVEIQEGGPYVVARFSSALDATSAFTTGHALAQEGLDMMSILGHYDAVIRDADDEHLIWWPDTNGIVLRTVSTTLLKFTVGKVNAIVRDKDGNIVPPTPINPSHHIAFRFFRLAQATDDLFDAYRNMYLAFEALLSSQFPKARTEQEISWLERALRSASTSLNLHNIAPPAPNDPIETLIEKIYKDARLPLFHAKEGRVYFAPQETSANRQVVSDALALLTKIVMRMAQTWFSARRIGGGVYFGWVYENATKILSECSAYASNFDAEVDLSENDLSHPRFLTAAKLHSRLAPELQRGSEPAILSTATRAELANANPVRRIELTTKSYPLVVHTCEAPIELGNILRFECLMHMRALNNNQPRSMFRQ